MAETIIWIAQNPTLEVTNQGWYIARYAAADFATYVYSATAQYIGLVVLDSDYGYGTVSGTPFGGLFPAGSVSWVHTVTGPPPGLVPIADAEVWISTDVAGANRIWTGFTDAFGVARDVSLALPALDPGPYYFWHHKVGWQPSPADPDLEVVV